MLDQWAVISQVRVCLTSNMQPLPASLDLWTLLLCWSLLTHKPHKCSSALLILLSAASVDASHGQGVNRGVDRQTKTPRARSRGCPKEERWKNLCERLFIREAFPEEMGLH